MCGGKSVWKQLYLVTVYRSCTECGSVGRGHKDRSPYITSALLLNSHGSYTWRDSIALCDTIYKVAYKMWIYITACSQCLWPASQNGCDVWIYVISQPFLTSWAAGADLLMLRERTFKLCFSCASHKVVVMCHVLCIISQPALMSGTRSLARILQVQQRFHYHWICAE